MNSLFLISNMLLNKDLCFPIKTLIIMFNISRLLLITRCVVVSELINYYIDYHLAYDVCIQVEASNGVWYHFIDQPW